MDGKWMCGKGDGPAPDDDSKPWGHKSKNRSKDPMDGNWDVVREKILHQATATSPGARAKETMDGKRTYGKGTDKLCPRMMASLGVRKPKIVRKDHWMENGPMEKAKNLHKRPWRSH